MVFFLRNSGHWKLVPKFVKCDFLRFSSISQVSQCGGHISERDKGYTHLEKQKYKQIEFTGLCELTCVRSEASS